MNMEITEHPFFTDELRAELMDDIGIQADPWLYTEVSQFRAGQLLIRGEIDIDHFNAVFEAQCYSYSAAFQFITWCCCLQARNIPAGETARWCY